MRVGKGRSVLRKGSPAPGWVLGIMGLAGAIGVSLPARAEEAPAGGKAVKEYSQDFNQGAAGWTGLFHDKSKGASEWGAKGGAEESGGWYMADPNERWATMSIEGLNLEMGPEMVMELEYKTNTGGHLHLWLMGEDGKQVHGWGTGYQATGDDIIKKTDFQKLTHELPAALEGYRITGLQIDIKGGWLNIDNVRLGPGKAAAEEPGEPELKITKRRNEYPHLLVLQGLYHELYKIEEAIQQFKQREVRTSQFKAMKNNQTALSYFPDNYDDLMGYDVIVMADVDTQSFGGRGKGGRMLENFVKHGGGLLILGGPYAYGEGDYRAIDALVPFKVKGPFDIKKLPPDTYLRAKDGSPLLKGISWRKKPVCLYQHELEVKPEAVTVLLAGDRPFLVTLKYGEGRVAALSGTVYGKALRGKTEYWEWDQWPLIMKNTLQWLAGR